ncbi:carboxypeptidase Q isoform X1 [Chroicocephalus ridibundus]|uniref:carboxypeptidase Q isoform X1 n=2 Tax=Chroicocephalus ridibundus TaxID=1192867 RepID=UPI002FDE38BC
MAVTWNSRRTGTSVENRKEKMKYVFLIFFMNLLPQYAGKSLRRDDSNPKPFEDIKNEIAGYTDVAKAIIDLAVHGKAQNRSYERLAVFADTIGPRLSGSKNLDAAIKYMFSALQEDGLENVHLEPVKIPHWERGEEFAMMLEPRNHSIAILGLGSSVPTPPEGITAEVIVVASFDELHKRAQEAIGKIVVYNEPFISYGETVRYRSQGAVEAAKVGAVASLIRSIASFSIHRTISPVYKKSNREHTTRPKKTKEYFDPVWRLLTRTHTWSSSLFGLNSASYLTPHTGWQSYHPDVPRIPTACISVEDAEMMSRMSLRGTKIVVHLKMGAKTYPDSPSFNTVAEIVGSKYPEQIVLVSGHLDSWDVGQGAMDDGGGAFISWEALSLIKDLGLRPKRTLRLVLWTAEEQGGIGAQQYYQLHKENISNFDIVMESDEGTFKPSGLGFTGNAKARDIVKEIMALLQPINVTDVYDNADGTDIDYWMRDGVPGASLRDDLSKYFWFHHSQGDTMTVQDPNQMNLCAAVWTVVSYVIADMEEMLPR